MKKSFKRLNDAVARGDRITGVPTGFDRYDKLTSGLHEGDLSIIAARPGMGKTSFVLNIAANVASPKGREVDGDPNQRWEEAGVGVVVFARNAPRAARQSYGLLRGAGRRQQDAHGLPEPAKPKCFRSWFATKR